MLVLLVGKMGVGKTSVAKALVKMGYEKIVTCTTRPKRAGEIDGVDYTFLPEKKFEEDKRNGLFLETTSYRVADGTVYQYGTRKYLDDKGKKVLIVNPSGLSKIKQSYPDSIVIYLTASLSTIKARAEKRGDTLEEIRRRCTADVKDFSEMDAGLIDYVIQTDASDATVSDVAKQINVCVECYENKKTVYISGAMTGSENYRDEFEKAEMFLRAQGYRVINPARFNAVLPPMSYDDYLSVDLYLLDFCDAIYLLNGWENSRGANAEHTYAIAKGIDVIYEKKPTTDNDGELTIKWVGNKLQLKIQQGDKTTKCFLAEDGIKQLYKFLKERKTQRG